MSHAAHQKEDAAGEQSFVTAITHLEKEEAAAEGRVQKALKEKEAILLKAREEAEEILEESREKAAAEKSAKISVEKKAIERKAEKLLSDAEEEAAELLKGKKAVSDAATALSKEFVEGVFSIAKK